jgi:hypothetical protein
VDLGCGCPLQCFPPDFLVDPFGGFFDEILGLFLGPLFGLRFERWFRSGFKSGFR